MTTPGQPVSRLRTPVALRALTLVWWVAAFGVGANAGRQIASLTFDTSWIGVFAFGLGIVVYAATNALLVVIPGLVGAFLYRVLLQGPLPRAATVLLVARVFAAGVAVGIVMAPVLRLGSRFEEAPTMLVGEGTMTLAMDGVAGYTAQSAAPAQCRSEPHGEGVSSVGAEGIGTIGGIAVSVVVSDAELDSAAVMVYLEPSISTVLSWSGRIEFVTRTVGNADAQVTFVDAVQASGQNVDPVPGDWPEKLSGMLTWSCGAWIAPAPTP